MHLDPNSRERGQAEDCGSVDRAAPRHLTPVTHLLLSRHEQQVYTDQGCPQAAVCHGDDWRKLLQSCDVTVQLPPSEHCSAL